MLCSSTLLLPFAPYKLSGRVYGTLLNHRSAVEAVGEAANKPPYRAAAKAPILYIKPANTLSAEGSSVTVPQGVDALEVGASLALIIRRPACRLSLSSAIEHVAGYLLVNDISVPHTPFYRPSIRFKARDGFCVLGSRAVQSAQLLHPDEVTLRFLVDGQLQQVSSTRDLVRPIAQLLVDVTEFMTLQPGDLLMAGSAGGAPLVKAGQSVALEADGFASLQTKFVVEPN